MRIVDLSMTVEECDSAPFAPDETYFKIKPYINWDEKGFVSNFVHMTVHAGTHIDSPHHFFRDKPSIERLPLEPLIGNGVVLDLTFKGSANARITPEDLDRAEQALTEKGVAIEPGGILLLRTDWPKGHTTTDPKWWNDSPCLTKEAAQFLADKGAALVGIDSYNIDDTADLTRPAHSILLGAGIPIVEHMCRLDQLPSNGFKFFAVPVKVKEMGTFPVRAFAIAD